ncbi:MAG TPA: hypothetical protein ENI42_06705, partial [Thermoplasmatales archaeon]|nr:hypothetical protein [Thermoplasmatales archaeon]
MDISYVAPVSGLVALLFAAYLVYVIRKESSGTAKMQELSKAIKEGAMAFLHAEYK